VVNEITKLAGLTMLDLSVMLNSFRDLLFATPSDR
jgi:hypothetical protein